MSFELQNANVVVTGAGRGIGLEICRRFTGLGANVCGWDLNCSAIRHESDFKHTVEVDITNEAAVKIAFDETIESLGSVEVLVANAGVNGPTKPTWEYSLAEWNHVMSVDLTGVFVTSRPFIHHMRANDYGRIIVIASVAGKEGNPRACAYGAAKAGAIGFVKGLAKELLPGNITVNAIAPAITETDLFEEMSEEYIAEKKAKIPMGRFCTPKDIADMTAWVASPLCAFTTGQVFDVSGGRATY